MKLFRLLFLSFFLIVTFYGGAYAALEDGLVAHYPFNGNANDESGNGNHGVVNGAILTTDRSGNPNSAYSFDGVNDYIRVANSSDFDSLGPNEISISGWIYKIGPYQVSLVSRWGGHKTGSFNTQIIGDDLRILTADGVNPVPDIYSNPNVISIGVWQHVAIVKTSTEMKFYVDGVNQGAFAYNHTVQDNNRDICIGYDCYYNYGINHFYGFMDDIRIYNRSLSEDEINELYQSEGPGEGQCEELLAETQAELAETQAELAETQAELAETQAELAETQAELEKANQIILEINTTITGNLNSVQTDLGVTIPGSTNLEQLENLIGAILGLNNGRKQGVIDNLTP